MTPEQKAAFINAQAACMLAELEAMKAFNHFRMSIGMALAYDEEAFLALPDKYGLGHNTVYAFLAG